MTDTDIFGSVPADFGPTQGILQNPCEERRRGRDDARSEDNEGAHDNPHTHTPGRDL